MNNRDVLRLNKYTRTALRRLFPLGALSPQSDPIFSNAPDAHDVFALTIPPTCLPANTKTYGDIFAKANRHVRSNQSLVELLGMLSMAITRPATGFGNLAQADSDRRGESGMSPSALTFTHNDRTYPRTAQYVEELQDNGGGFCGLRLWIFVMDPQLDLSASLADVARTNEVIYNSRKRNNQRPMNPNRPPTETVNRRDRYISHARVTSEADIVALMGSVVSTGAESVNAQRHPKRRRAAGMLRSALVSERTIQGNSIASLKTILSPALSFIFHSEHICDLQRDLTGYFVVSDEGAEVVAGGAEDEGAPIQAEEESADISDEEMNALNAFLGNEADDPMNIDDAEAQGFPDPAMAVLDGLAQIRFASFPYPERVQSIPSEFFGETLLNIPLARYYMAKERDQDTDESTRPTLPLMFRVLESDYERWDAALDEERLEFLETEYRAHITNYLDESSELFFDLDVDDIAFDKEAQEEIIYKIYLAAQHQLDQWRANDVLPEIREKLNQSSPVELHLEPTQARLNADGRMEMVYHNRERPLRETITLEAMTWNDLEHYARVDDILSLRLDNNAAQNDILREYAPNTPEFYEAMRSWRYPAAERFMTVAMESENVSPAWKKQRDWYKRLQVNKQWARVELTHPDLSFYTNTMLLQVQRFNQIYNGASTQTLFLLMQRVVLGTPMYKWDLRPNLLVYGRGGVGKSHPLTACESMSVPGLIKCYSHITEKAFSVNKPYSDETFCMHEAPGFMLGVDERGKEVPSNPILKDRLIRQRSGTLAFGQSESGERIRIEQEVMVMGNAILLTNDIIPSDQKALTQRFILLAVHHTKRKGFRKGDYANLGAEEESRGINTDQKEASQLFSFYCSLVFQMAKAHVIPDPSTDGAAKMLREILSLFSERTHLDSDDARKRIKVVDIMAITTVMSAVSTGLFSRLSDDFRYDIRPDGTSETRPFDVSMIIDHVMPRLYATDEILMDSINLMDFMFEPRVHYDVLRTVVGSLNGNVHTGEPCTMSTVNFRYIHNPRYARGGGRRFHHRRQHTTALARLNQSSTGQPTIGNVHISQNTTGGSFDDHATEEAEYEIDPCYVVVSNSGFSQILSMIAEATEGSRPSENEVHRVLKMLSETQRKCHPAYLVPVEDEFAADDSNEDGEENERAIEDGNYSESESGLIYPSPLGARNLFADGDGPAVVRRRPETSQVDIYENKRFRLVIDTTKEATPKFIVQFEPDPRHREKRVVAVMVEALKDDTFRNALLKAACDVMSCRNQPAEGKRYFTPKDYEFCMPNGARETMPQYKQIIHVPHSDSPLRFAHVSVGTQDSHAALANCTNDGGGVEAMMQSMLQSNLYTELDKNETINSHFLMSHLRACDMPLDNMERFLPEWADNEIYERTMAIHRESPQRYTFVYNYPESVAKKEITKRMVSDVLRRNPSDKRGKNFRIKSRKIGELMHLAPAIASMDGVTIDPNKEELIVSNTVNSENRSAIQKMKRAYSDAMNGVKTFNEDYRGKQARRVRENVNRPRINDRQNFTQKKADSFSAFLTANESQLAIESGPARVRHQIKPASPSTRKRSRKHDDDAGRPKKRSKNEKEKKRKSRHHNGSQTPSSNSHLVH